MAGGSGTGPARRTGGRSAGMRRPEPATLAACPRLREVAGAKLELRWSPQQIAAWLKMACPGDLEMHVSHETIDLSLFVRHGARCARSCSAACAPAGPAGGRRA